MNTSPTSLAAPPSGRTDHRPKILLVDDDTGVLEVTACMLEHMGCHITATASSTQALRLFQAAPQHYDLIITDMIMPEMQGDALTRAVLAIRPGLPVIIATGYGGEALKNVCDLDIQGIIHKPFLMHEMQGMVQQALKGWPRAA